MTEVTFLASVQGHQLDRIREIADRLRAQWPDMVVTVVEGDAAKGDLQQHKLAFGPAILIDKRLEYVGIPRWRFLQERLAQVARGLPNPRTAAPATAGPAAKLATPAPGAKPAVERAARPTAAEPATPRKEGQAESDPK